MKLRSQIIRIVYWGLASCVAIVCIASILETTRFSNHFTDIAPILLIPLFIVLPIVGLTLFLLNRKCRQEHTKPQRIRLHVARSIIVVGWLFSCVPVGFIIVTFRLWPLSLADGPDTNYAREGFARVTGFKSPSSASKIYCHQYAGLTDGGVRLRFQVTSSSVVQRIAAQKKMTRQVESRRKKDRGPRWWREKSKREELEYYARKVKLKGYWNLWYDPETGTAWYEEFDF